MLEMLREFENSAAGEEEGLEPDEEEDALSRALEGIDLGMIIWYVRLGKQLTLQKRRPNKSRRVACSPTSSPAHQVPKSCL